MSTLFISRRLCIFTSGTALALAACSGADEGRTDPGETEITETQTSPYPAGSYSYSCTNIAVADDVLTADCESLDGSSKSATLPDLDACIASVGDDGDIANLDGNLMCVPTLPLVDGFEFPVAEATVNGWISDRDSVAQYDHAWGIWAGLTDFVGTMDGVDVRAFQTWATPSTMKYRIENGLTASDSPTLHRSLSLELHQPDQFKRMPPAKLAALSSGTDDIDTSVVESVAYNPPAARHAIQNKLFLQSTLDSYLAQGMTEIPVFPNASITIKPVYKIITSSKLEGTIYTMPGWPGTPDVTPDIQANGFPETAWGACVYVDVDLMTSTGSAIDTGCANRNASNTFALSDFIHTELTVEDAEYLNDQLALDAAAGDTAILVGMHVTSRENTRWTWQSFWWSASPDTPRLPSSTPIAERRPATLDAPSRHYAMTITYQMVDPVQPETGGVSEGQPVIGYNPHLEAGFGPGTFGGKTPIIEGQPKAFDLGIQSNCMSCHSRAVYFPESAGKSGEYVADAYMDLDDDYFTDGLKLDFAWSIKDELVKDDTQGTGTAGQ